MSAGDNSRFSYGKPQWDMDRGELAASSTEVGGQVASKTDLESLLPNYGGAVCSVTSSIANRFFPFDTAKGYMKGCHIAESSDGITLDTVGAWDANVNGKAWSNGLIPCNSELRLELFDPDDQFVERQSMSVISAVSSGQNVSVFTRFVVDAPGYTVRAYAMTDGASQWSCNNNAFLSVDYRYIGGA